MVTLPTCNTPLSRDGRGVVVYPQHHKINTKTYAIFNQMKSIDSLKEELNTIHLRYNALLEKQNHTMRMLKRENLILMQKIVLYQEDILQRDILDHARKHGDNAKNDLLKW